MMTETSQAAFINRFGWILPVDTFCLEGKINLHDGVLFDDANEHHQSHETINVEVRLEDQQRCQRAQACRGKP